MWLVTVFVYFLSFFTRLIYSILHFTFTFTYKLTFNRLLIFLVILGIIANYFFKINYLNKYTELREKPLSKEDGFDLHPDQVGADDWKGGIEGLRNYLDDFLSAIRVFGYLEKPVFHELARHLQTRRLVAGDTLSLDSDKSFYIVVDGNVQVFAQTDAVNTSRGSFDDEDTNGFQLINEVKSGGTLSSLFTILSLFTEDVRLRYDEEYDSMRRMSNSSGSHEIKRERSNSDGPFHFKVHEPSPSSSGQSPRRPSFSRRNGTSKKDSLPNREVSPLNLDAGSSSPPSHLGPNFMPHHKSPLHKVRRTSSSSSLSSEDTATLESISSHPAAALKSALEIEEEDPEIRSNTPSQPPTPTRDGTGTPFKYGLNGGGKKFGFNNKKEAVVARATVDTTLAVIPAEAFKRLTHKFPNASAHIVQVILTRLQRVTFLTAHKYLGLTKEVLRAEKSINDLACYPLPSSFYESGGLQRLRQRFLPEKRAVEKGLPDSKDDYFALGLTTPYERPELGASMSDQLRGLRPAEGYTLRPRGPSSATTGKSPSVSPQKPKSKNLRLDAEALGNAPSLQNADVKSPQTPRPPGMDNRRRSTYNFGSVTALDLDLRQNIMECISKAIGLLQSPLTPAHSTDGSPNLMPVDHNAPFQRAVFNSSYGSLSFLGSQAFDEESSITTSSNPALTPMELENEIEILFFPQDSTLVKAGEKSGLYFVIDGIADISMAEDQITTKIKNNTTGQFKSALPNRPPPDSNRFSRNRPSSTSWAYDEEEEEDLNFTETEKPKPLFSVKPGGIAGYLSSLSGFPSYVDITARTDVYVGHLPASALEKIMDKQPIVLLTLAKRLISLLSPLVLHIDSALDWVHVNAGQVIYRQGEKADSFYVVINGRLRSIEERSDGRVDILGEYGVGESVGELDCITASDRPSTLHAIRDSELARMPMTLFNAISVRHPAITVQITRIIASRVRSEIISKRKGVGFDKPWDSVKPNYNLKTVAIVPASRNVPVVEFTNRLFAALEDMGAPTAYLNQATVVTAMGRHAFRPMGKLKLAGWLSETEAKSRMVLYLADAPVNSPWTQTCIRQADCIFVVADATREPTLGEYEKFLVTMKTTARKELILLHPERDVPPGSTRQWLKNRPWINTHHHVEMASIQSHTLHTDTTLQIAALQNLRAKVRSRINKFQGIEVSSSATRSLPPNMSDCARLARRLCGKSIGLVLGGGGARGIAHMGVLKALSERNIPVDMVGGTSIGSFVGGLYSRHADLLSTHGRLKRFSGRMSTLWRILTDLTYPIAAYTTGHEFNRGIYKEFYDIQIEDMWIPYFCNTTNITWSRMEIHTSGYAWRYIRASMSLAGMLPPLCDEGMMLVDGGYVDNLPVATMLSMGAESIFAVDVGSIDDTSAREFGETVSGWWVLLNRWNPWSKTQQVPNITEIQSRLTYVSSVKTLEEAKVTPGVLYMRMPVTNFGTLEFKRFQEIHDIGWSSAKKMFQDWEKEGKLPDGMASDVGDGGGVRGERRGKPVRRNSI